MLASDSVRDVREVSNWAEETDVLVIGLGCAGASAACEAASAGADVVVAERASGGGGTSALSGGVIYLLAPTIINDGVVSARGGYGGRRGTNPCNNGGDGGLGRIRLSLLPEKCEALGSYNPPLPGTCQLTGNYIPGTAYVGLYPY